MNIESDEWLSNGDVYLMIATILAKLRDREDITGSLRSTLQTQEDKIRELQNHRSGVVRNTQTGEKMRGDVPPLLNSSEQRENSQTRYDGLVR